MSLHPLELDLQVVGKLPVVGAGNLTQVLWKNRVCS